MKLIVGLGNPGPKYASHRHSIGQYVLDQYVQEKFPGTSRNIQSKLQSLLYTVRDGGQQCFLCKPLTFMNNSGQPVHAVMKYYNISASELLVLHDEIELPVGTTKTKHGGGLAGHNGLKSIAHYLGTRDFARIRIGVDRPAHKDMVADYVLSPFSSQEQKEIIQQIPEIARMIDAFLSGDLHFTSK